MTRAELSQQLGKAWDNLNKLGKALDTLEITNNAQFKELQQQFANMLAQAVQRIETANTQRFKELDQHVLAVMANVEPILKHM